MIWNIIYYVIGSVLRALVWVLRFIPVSIPAGVQTSLNFIGSYVAYLRPIFDTQALGDAIVFLVVFYAAWFSYKIILRIGGVFPWFNFQHPHKN